MKRLVYDYSVIDDHTGFTAENFVEEWAKLEAWDGTTGHAPHCRAIPQIIRSTRQTGPCTCGRSDELRTQ